MVKRTGVEGRGWYGKGGEKGVRARRDWDVAPTETTTGLNR